MEEINTRIKKYNTQGSSIYYYIHIIFVVFHACSYTILYFLQETKVQGF